MFQSFNLIPTLTALENITLPLSLAGRRPDPAWLDHVIDTVGLRTRLTHRPSELSGGQQQRVAVARALASRPEIIFADEPTGNLDSRSGAEILTFLRNAVRELGQTVVMVTHDPTAAAYADRAVFLADGRIVGRPGRPHRRHRPRPHQEPRELTAMIATLTLKQLAANKLRLARHRLRRHPRRRLPRRHPHPHRHHPGHVRQRCWPRPTPAPTPTSGRPARSTLGYGESGRPLDAALLDTVRRRRRRRPGQRPGVGLRPDRRQRRQGRRRPEHRGARHELGDASPR